MPFPYTLVYDDALINKRFTYAIQAQISLGERVLYRTTTRFPALTNNAPKSVDVVVDLREPISASLAGSRWEVSEIAGQPIASDRQPMINFLADGNVSIDSGCNKFYGRVEISGATIRFSDRMAGTMMACPPPYDRQEQDLLARERLKNLGIRA